MQVKWKYIIRKISYRVPKIIEVTYKWSVLLDYNFKPDMIVYHHTVETNLTPEEIDKMHKKRGWSGIGYHFYIRRKGEIYRGRPEKSVGAHALAVNNRAFGIALEGNFNSEKLTQKQKKSLVLLSKYLIKKYNIKYIRRHKDVGDTECPGENFPFKWIKTKLKM